MLVAPQVEVGQGGRQAERAFNASYVRGGRRWLASLIIIGRTYAASRVSVVRAAERLPKAREARALGRRRMETTTRAGTILATSISTL